MTDRKDKRELTGVEAADIALTDLELQRARRGDPTTRIHRPGDRRVVGENVSLTGVDPNFVGDRDDMDEVEDDDHPTRDS